jgi:hypothetical protein
MADGSTTGSNSSFDGTTWTVTNLQGTILNSYSYSTTWEFDTEKNTITKNTIRDGESFNSTTIWNWVDGSSKKEMIEIDGDLYRVTKLTGKELQIEYEYSSNTFSNSVKYSFEKN